MFSYNSTKKEYKSPFGAVSRGRRVTFRVKSDMQPYFVYHYDGEQTGTELAMQYDRDGFYRINVSFKKTGLYFYHFVIDTPEGRVTAGLKGGECALGEWLDEWQLTVYDKGFSTPKWVKGGIMYQIFPDRFCRSVKYTPGKTVNDRHLHEDWYDVPEFIYDTPDFKANDFFGGNIDGVIEKLGYLKELGVTMIYFNPIFESPENHRYSTGNYKKIDPYFGTNEDFERLAEKCHQLGIKIILDGVFSHTGADSIYFNKYGHYPTVGAYNSKESPYYHWYTFHEDGSYDCWWNFENLPNVNETAPDYLDYITGKDNGVLSFWQKKGADGWRLDVADELPDLFIDRLRQTVKGLDSEAFIIGEVWEDATNKFAYGNRRRYLTGKQLDSVMNYPWRTAILNFVKEGSGKAFEKSIMSIAENYPPQVLDCLMNSLSTHDTPRIINELGVEHEVEPEDYASYTLTPEEYSKGKELLKKAAFLQFTLPGIPCIYYGDEVGLTGFKDPYCRMCYPCGREDIDLLEFFRSLAKIRTEHTERFTGGIEFLTADHGFLSYKRHDIICTLSLYDELKDTDKKVLFEDNHCRIEEIPEES